MTWVKLDDTFPNNPKILPISDKAFRLYVEGLCYSNQYLTDGFLAQAAVDRLDSGKALPELIEAGLWIDVEGGAQIHDYCKHQSTREDVEVKREANRERVMRYRSRSNANVMLPETETETEAETEVRIQKHIEQDFERFWNIYPRKTGKGAARASFEKAIKKTDLDTMLASAKHYADDPNRKNEFTALPATWLNQERWADGPLLSSRSAPKGFQILRELLLEDEMTALE